MPCSSSSSSSSTNYDDDPDYRVDASDDEPDYRAASPDNGNGATDVILPTHADPERVVSFLRTQDDVDAVCEKYGVPKGQYTARPAGDLLRASSPPPPGAVCVYAHALEAGMRVPLHPFYRDALAHLGVAPTQLAPNAWRIMAGFLVLCHSAGVPPSLAVFRHFFGLLPLLPANNDDKRKRWYFFRSRDTSGLCLAGLPQKNRDWKKGFFFLSSPEPWGCPVEWGEPPESSFVEPALDGEEEEMAEKLLQAHDAAPVDLRTYLCDSNLAAAKISPASPAPSSCARTSAGSKGMDPSVYGMMKTMLAEKAAATAVKASAKKVKTEPRSLCGKKRSLDNEADGEAGPSPSSVRPNSPPDAHGCWLVPTSVCSPPPGFPRTPQHFATGNDIESTDWKAARELLQGAIAPAQERVFAASRPSDVLASCGVAVLKGANCTSFSLGYALELEKKLAARDAEVAALQDQLNKAKAKLAALKGPLRT